MSYLPVNYCANLKVSGNKFPSYNPCLRFLLVALCLVMNAAGYAASGYRIEVQIAGIKNATCYLGWFAGTRKIVPVDTGFVDSSGHVTFLQDESFVPGMYVLECGGFNLDMLIAEPVVSISTDTLDPVMNAQVIQSEENRIYFDYRKTIAYRRRVIDSLKQLSVIQVQQSSGLRELIEKESRQLSLYRSWLFSKYPRSLAVKIIKAGHEPKPNTPLLLPGGKADTVALALFYKDHLFDLIDFSEPAVLRTPYFYSRLEKFVDVIRTMPADTIASACDTLIKKAGISQQSYRFVLEHLWYYFGNTAGEGIEETYVHLAEQYYLKGLAEWVDEAALNSIRQRVDKMKPLLKGQKAPAFTMKDPEGKETGLYDVKAKYTVLYFWDSQCGHCIETTPRLHDLYKKISKKDVEVYAVTIEQADASWKSFIQKHGLKDWVNVWDPATIERVFRKYNLRTTPAIFLLDSEKRIVKKNISLKELEQFFNADTLDQ